MNDIHKRLAAVLRCNWEATGLRGIFAIMFGVVCWLGPITSITVLVLLFGTFVLVDGIFHIWLGLAGRKEFEGWWMFLLWGLAGIGAGIITFAAYRVTTLALLILIAAWVIATGILEIVIAISLRKEITGAWLLMVSGLAAMMFGVLLVAQPMAGAVVLIWLIGTCAIALGIGLVIVAIRMRRFSKELLAS